MQIELKDVAHDYHAQKKPKPGKRREPAGDPDEAPGAAAIALQPLSTIFADGGSYALLGPSGCGKTTLLNIISGLVYPGQGRVYFGAEDVTDRPTPKRNIAQMFQFPVIYDTMTVYENLAFPLRNRRQAASIVDARVREIAAELELEELLHEKARGLGAAHKQIISLGRGLVRSDVAAILLDEPLTVIDPGQKWELRRKLKEIQRAHGITTIYVTHDQLEALTFAETILVMQAGRIVQKGTPRELFESPAHPFVGYFIGSPGMNFLPCVHEAGAVRFGSRTVLGGDDLARVATGGGTAGPGLLGIRPEYVQLTRNENDPGLPGRVKRIEDRGADRIVTVAVEPGGDASGGVHDRALLDEPNQGPFEILLLTETGDLPGVGDHCRLHFRSEYVQLFPGETMPAAATRESAPVRTFAE